MIAYIIASLLLLVAVVGVATVVLGREEIGPDCEHCSTETSLVDQECEHVGAGWLVRHQVYECPRCLSTTRREYVSGPNDFLNAA